MWSEHIGGLNEMSLPEAGASLSLSLRDLRSMRFSEAYSRARTLLWGSPGIGTQRSRLQSEKAKGEKGGVMVGDDAIRISRAIQLVK